MNGQILNERYEVQQQLGKKTGRTFTETEVKQMASSVLEILTYLHGQNPPVIHRDIKPSNILLTNRSGNSVGQLYLVDFGSVQTVVTESGTRTDVLVQPRKLFKLCPSKRQQILILCLFLNQLGAKLN